MDPNRHRFDGKVAIVTGGGCSDELLGVGAAISDTLAAEGCRVGVLDRDLDLAAATVERIARAGGQAMAIQGDVSQSEDCRRAVDAVTSTYGRLDVLVNNVGIFSAAPLIDVTEDDWDRHMNVNVKGMMLMTRYAARKFGEGAAIVNISSSGAMTPVKGTSAYVTSKGAVISLTLSMAVELTPTRANCICPDRIWTPRFVKRVPPDQVEAVRDARRRATLLGTEGTAVDVALATAFLASDDARWITGQVLLVDGGKSLLAGVTEAKLSPSGRAAN